RHPAQGSHRARRLRPAAALRNLAGGEVSGLAREGAGAVPDTSPDADGPDRSRRSPAGRADTPPRSARPFRVASATRSILPALWLTLFENTARTNAGHLG